MDLNGIVTQLEFIHDGLIPARKIAGRYKIEKSDLVDFIKYSAYWN